MNLVAPKARAKPKLLFNTFAVKLKWLLVAPKGGPKHELFVQQTGLRT